MKRIGSFKVIRGKSNALLLTGVAALICGCRNPDREERRVFTDILNAASIDFLIRNAQQRGERTFAAVRFEEFLATEFRSPNGVHVVGTWRDRFGKTRTGSYDLAFTVEDHIVRVRMTATTLPGVRIDSSPIQQFDEALSRAFTTDAMQAHGDAGIQAVLVENQNLLIEVEVPMR